jgi:hypothetical protein
MLRRACLVSTESLAARSVHAVTLTDIVYLDISITSHQVDVTGKVY